MSDETTMTVAWLAVWVGIPVGCGLIAWVCQAVGNARKRDRWRKRTAEMRVRGLPTTWEPGWSGEEKRFQGQTRIIERLGPKRPATTADEAKIEVK